MKNEPVKTVLISALLGIGGWFVGYLTTIKRDRLAKRRDLGTGYLFDAFKRPESAGNRHEPSREDALKLETAIADIQ